MLHSHNSTSLSIHVSSATDLVSVQRFGKQDPYLQFSLDFNQRDSYLKTYTHKNAGENATWNQTFTITLNGEPELYIEVLDEENTVNEVIGFAAIPINQVVHASGANMNGLFDIYDTKGNRAGLVNLQLAALGFPNSAPPNFDCEPVRGQSYMHEEHCARMRSTNKKATGVAVGGALLGGALAIGAGLLGKKLYEDHQQAEEEEQRQAEEAERLRQEEEEKRRQEREEFDQDRARFEREKSEWEQGSGRRDDDECRGSDSSDNGDARKWNPVGTYDAGDRVKYHGQVYMCLQGHTSNPTWQPGAAHSLWQAE
ncbi:MAG: C2 domain-containing protein [Benjaminiella poitrasii]|nr:MAG: C2 domain-containing protein [Benjaminiella poitrasii]